MVDSSTVDRGFEPRSCETKDYNVGVCCFSTKYIKKNKKKTLRILSKDWLARIQVNVSEWGDMSIDGLLFQ